MYVLNSIFLLQSVIAKGLLNSLQEKGSYVNVVINFSAQTNSIRTQEIVESKLEKKRKTILGTSTVHLHTCTLVVLITYMYTVPKSPYLRCE